MTGPGAGTGGLKVRKAQGPPWLWWGAVGVLCALWAGGGWWAGGTGRPDSTDVPEEIALSSPSASPSRGPAEIHVCTDLAKAKETTSPLLPAGAKALHAYVRLDGEIKPAQVAAEWWWCGERVGGAKARRVEAGELSGYLAVTLGPPGDTDGFGPGVGEVEMRQGGARVARGSFVVSERAQEIPAQQAPALGETRVVASATGRAVGDDGRIKRATANFEGTEKIWACFEYVNADPGAGFVMRWYCEGREIEAARTTVAAKSRSGVAQGWIVASGRVSLPPAGYSVTLSYGSETRPLGEAKFRVTQEVAVDAQASSASNSRSRSSSSPLE